MPLRRAQHVVREFCDEYGVSYCETSLWNSYRQTLRHLHRVAAPTATLAPDSAA